MALFSWEIISHEILKSFTWQIYCFSILQIWPRLKHNRNIRTPDYTLNGIDYDLKGVNKNDDNTLHNKIKDSKGQTNNFIFDIKNNNLDLDDIITKINELYEIHDIRFFNNIIIVKDNKILNIFKRKK